MFCIQPFSSHPHLYLSIKCYLGYCLFLFLFILTFSVALLLQAEYTVFICPLFLFYCPLLFQQYVSYLSVFILIVFVFFVVIACVVFFSFYSVAVVVLCAPAALGWCKPHFCQMLMAILVSCHIYLTAIHISASLLASLSHKIKNLKDCHTTQQNKMCGWSPCRAVKFHCTADHLYWFILYSKPWPVSLGALCTKEKAWGLPHESEDICLVRTYHINTTHCTFYNI